MNYQRLSIAGIAILLLFSCTESNLPSGEKIPSSSAEYLMFGHNDGFCMKCDAVYKITDGKLFGENHQVINDPDSTQLKLLPDSSYQLVASLTNQIPKRLVMGSTDSINRIGMYFPDVGHTYIEVSQNDKIYRWYIESRNLPDDLLPFVKEVNEAIVKLN
jgi:hypothetical protein